jgi:hypothetical protein
MKHKKAQKRSKKVVKKHSTKKTTTHLTVRKAMSLGTGQVIQQPLCIGKANDSDVIFDLDILRTSHMIVTGASGSGKSYTFRVLAEQLYNIVPIFLFDPEEEYLTLKDKFDFVIIGGDGADAPIHPQTAEITIKRLMAANMSAIFNLYSLSVEDQYLWVETAIHTLMNLPRDAWHPVVVMLDEAHLWCPEKGEGNVDARNECVNLAKRGRKRGIMNIWATQRLSNVDKSAVAELQNYLVGHTVLHTDQERTAKVLGVVRHERDEFFNQMHKLSKGFFFAQGAALVSNKRRVLQKVNKAQTEHLEPGKLKAIEFPSKELIASVCEEISSVEISDAAPVNQVSFTTKGLVAGLYKAGSAMATLYEFLAANDSQWLLQTELQSKIEADVVGRLKALQAHGQQYGRWSVEKLNNRWRMIVAKVQTADTPDAVDKPMPVSSATEIADAIRNTGGAQ